MKYKNRLLERKLDEIQFASELLAAHSSQEINHKQLGRELGVDRKTALAWTEIAQATFQWFTIPAFSRNPIKKIAGKEKGYFSDTGFLCYLQRISSPEAIGSHPLKGSLFETYYQEPAKADKSFAMNCDHIICYQQVEKVSLNSISNDLHQYLAVLL